MIKKSRVLPVVIALVIICATVVLTIYIFSSNTGDGTPNTEFWKTPAKIHNYTSTKVDNSIHVDNCVQLGRCIARDYPRG